MSPNLKAFLDTIAVSELGTQLIAKSDNGYNVIVGSTALKPDLFTSYKDHPRKVVKLANGIASSAAGRYQILEAIYDFYKQSLGLADFGKVSQDLIALQLIKECKAVGDIEAGRFDSAIFKCKSRWASLPGANYPGQRMNKLADLRDAFNKAGGTIA